MYGYTDSRGNIRQAEDKAEADSQQHSPTPRWDGRLSGILQLC